MNEIIVGSLKTQFLNSNYGKTPSINIQAHDFIRKLLIANCEFIIANWFDGLAEESIRQHIIDCYNSGAMQTDLNIFKVDFQSISATIVQQPQEVA